MRSPRVGDTWNHCGANWKLVKIDEYFHFIWNSGRKDSILKQKPTKYIANSSGLKNPVMWGDGDWGWQRAKSIILLGDTDDES